MPQPRKHEHWSIEGKQGYIRGRGRGAVQTAYLRIADKDVSLGFPFVPANKKRALNLLREEQEQREAVRLAMKFGMSIPDNMRSEEPERGRPVTLQSLIDIYKRETFSHVSVSVRHWYDYGLRYYITKEVLWDAANEDHQRAAYEIIKKMLTDANNQTTIADDTKAKYYDKVAKVFDWFVSEEYLMRNPMRALPKAKRKRKSTKQRWTGEEAKKILEEMRKLEASRHYSLATEIMSVGGFRRCELMRMTREEAAENYMRITAKGQTREVPVLTIPGLRELFDTMLALPRSKKRPEHLFPDERPDKWLSLFRSAVVAAEIEPRGRTLYCCRKTAIWWMEDELLWDRQDICDVVGHDEDTDDMFYRENPRAKDLEDRINRRVSGGQATKNEGTVARSLPVAGRHKRPSKPLQANP